MGLLKTLVKYTSPIGYGLVTQHDAAKGAKREMAAQSEVIRGQSIKADKIAKDQQMASDRALQTISQGRVRAASRRVRGGLYGDVAGQAPVMAARLGG